jgi:hypothetical protein
MTDPNTAVAHRAREAQFILEHPLFRDAIQSVRDRIMREWRSTKPEEVDVRERSYQALRALDFVEGALTKHVTTGKMASS